MISDNAMSYLVAMKPITIAVTIGILSIASAFSQETKISVRDLIPKILTDAEGKEVEASSLDGKTVAIYFSAHWCPPCRQFTPRLVKARDKIVAENKDLEVVFASMDRSEAQKTGYIKEAGMKWLTVPGANSEATQKLANEFGVRGIPNLVVISPDGKIITKKGVEQVYKKGEKAFEKWLKKSE